MRATCGRYSDWTEECRSPGCESCGTLTFALGVPVGCTCPTELTGEEFNTGLVVYHYYPTIDDAYAAELERLRALPSVS